MFRQNTFCNKNLAVWAQCNCVHVAPIFVAASKAFLIVSSFLIVYIERNMFMVTVSLKYQYDKNLYEMITLSP